MAKGTQFTLDDLMGKGMVEVSPGVWQKAKSTPQPREIAKAAVNTAPTKKEKKLVYFKNQDIKQVYAEAEQNNYIYIPGNVPSLKNGKQIFKTKSGKPFITSSDLCKDYMANKKTHYAMFKSRFLRMIKGKPFPITVRFVFIRDKHKAFDYGNITQIVLDCMTGSAYYPKTRDKNKKALRDEQRKAFAWIPDDDADHLVPEYGEGYGYDPKLAGVIIKVI